MKPLTSSAVWLSKEIARWGAVAKFNQDMSFAHVDLRYSISNMLLHNSHKLVQTRSQHKGIVCRF